MMAFAAIAASLSGALASLRASETRASGLVLGAAGLSGLAHLLARELLAPRSRSPRFRKPALDYRR